jgi:hypothetical protein
VEGIDFGVDFIVGNSKKIAEIGFGRNISQKARTSFGNGGKRTSLLPQP